mmetsp:Transcript_121505/g.278434  ORF Transcript_121505/g.278434 Transcript_121505/m.278434 type:complete len:519 (-) Transcript_121505:166-1722(-)
MIPYVGPTNQGGRAQMVPIPQQGMMRTMPGMLPIPGALPGMLPGSIPMNTRTKFDVPKLSAPPAPKEKKADVQPNAKPCHLHTKHMQQCRFCKKYKEALKEAEAAHAQAAKPKKETFDLYRDKAPLSNPIQLSPVLKDRVFGSIYFKGIFRLETFDEFIDELYSSADHADPYSGTVDIPSALWCILFKLFKFRLTGDQLFQMLNNRESPYVRACGALYVRLGVEPKEIWTYLGDYLLDDEVFHPTMDKHGDPTTFGEWVEQLLVESKYCDIFLPRLPVPVKKAIDANVAMLPQFRLRVESNRRNLDLFRHESCRVEVFWRNEWEKGTVLRVCDEEPSRLRLEVLLDTTEEAQASIGQCILLDERKSEVDRRSRSRSPRNSRSRSRSRSRRRAGHVPRGAVDWTRSRGPVGQETLVKELQRQQKLQAINSSAVPTYSKRPPRRHREGDHDEPRRDRDREHHRDRDRDHPPAEPAPSSASAAQAAIFAKYGANSAGGKGTSLATSSAASDVEQPTVYRFG